MSTKVVKYPIELEFTDYCGLKCKSCPNDLLINKSFLQEDDFDNILHYLKWNIESISFINISGIGDAFLHPNNIDFLEKIIQHFSGMGVNILFPTKGQSFTGKHVELMKKFMKAGFLINISVGIYSLNTKIYEVLSGGHSLEDVFRFMKKLKDNEIPFSLELLQEKKNKKEIEYAKKLASIFNCGFDIQGYHNFSGEMNSNSISDNICTFDSDAYTIPGFYCNFVPFVDSKGMMYSCSISSKNKKWYLGHIDEIFVKYPSYLDLVKYIYQDFLGKEKCFSCSFYQNYERKPLVGNNSYETV